MLCASTCSVRKVPVGSYEEIEQRMKQGTNSRTVAATNMNETSSRAHTVVCSGYCMNRYSCGYSGCYSVGSVSSVGSVGSGLHTVIVISASTGCLSIKIDIIIHA